MSLLPYLLGNSRKWQILESSRQVPVNLLYKLRCIKAFEYGNINNNFSILINYIQKYCKCTKLRLSDLHFKSKRRVLGKFLTRTTHLPFPTPSTFEIRKSWKIPPEFTRPWFAPTWSSKQQTRKHPWNQSASLWKRRLMANINHCQLWSWNSRTNVYLIARMWKIPRININILRNVELLYTVFISLLGQIHDLWKLWIH